MILEGEEEEDYTGEGEGKDGRSTLGNLSPISTQPSISDVPPIFKAPQSSDEKAEQPRLDLNTRDAKDAETPDISPKVDTQPLTPFKNLHKFWEGKSTFTHMTKSVIGRILRKQATQEGIDSDANEEAKESDASGANVDEVGNMSQQSQIAQDTADKSPKTSTFAVPLAKVKDTLSDLAGAAVAFILSAVTLVGMFMYGHISIFVGMARTMFGQYLLRKVAAVSGMIAQDHTSAMSPKDLSEHTGTNLSNLFLEEALEDEKLSGDNAVYSLDSKEKALLKRVNDEVTASITAKYRTALSALKSTKACCVIAACALISVILVCSYMLHQGFEVIQDGVGVKEDPLAYISLDEGEDLRCFSTRMTNFVSVPLWELNLSPNSFEAFDEESQKTGPRSWLSALVTLFVILLLFGVERVTLPFLKSAETTHETLSGIWTEEEHEQFLAGYKVYGNRWKLVSAFVPSRTHAQVARHGGYWLKIRSPGMMKKARKVMTPTTKTTPKKTPASASSSTTSTPKKSNKTKLLPIKGILLEKDDNKYKNVTPRSAERKKRMTKMQGPTSDPVKRRVRIQEP